MPMNARTIQLLLVVIATGGLFTGCGETETVIERTSKVSSSTRIERCVEQYPDSTKADCEEWEADEALGDDGTHRDHDG